MLTRFTGLVLVTKSGVTLNNHSVECACFRLHREALKQSATDPVSGKIDVSILTTGMSASSRRRRAELAVALRKMLESKAKTKAQSLAYQKVFTEFKEQSDLVRPGLGYWAVH